MLLITISGLICGAQGWKDLELFGKQKIDFLKAILPFKNSVPADDTFRRFFRALDPEQFKTCFINWIKTLQKEHPKFISIDGKTLRRSHDRGLVEGAPRSVNKLVVERTTLEVRT